MRCDIGPNRPTAGRIIINPADAPEGARRAPVRDRFKAVPVHFAVPEPRPPQHSHLLTPFRQVSLSAAG